LSEKASDDAETRTAATLRALAAAVDPRRFIAALDETKPLASAQRSEGQRPNAGRPAMDNATLGMLVLADLLDESVLAARPGEAHYPLRLLLAELATRLDQPSHLAFACAMNLYFRATFDEETQATLAFEVSRTFYEAARAPSSWPADVSRAAAPQLAELLSVGLPRLVMEPVDHVRNFDSSICERHADSDPTSASIVERLSFLCRVRQSGLVRKKALVRT
jgi:hypothetical protein